jgi:hypothetical protein
VFAAGEDTALAPLTSAFKHDTPGSNVSLAAVLCCVAACQVFAAGEDTALAPLTTAINLTQPPTCILLLCCDVLCCTACPPQVFAAGEDTALAPLTSAINKGLASSSPAEHPALLRDFAQQYLDTMRSKVSNQVTVI